MAAPPRNAPGSQPPLQSSKVPSEVEIPRDQDALKRVSSPMATISSHLDPWP
jgi:hypothetical protein